MLPPPLYHSSPPGLGTRPWGTLFDVVSLLLSRPFSTLRSLKWRKLVASSALLCKTPPTEPEHPHWDVPEMGKKRPTTLAAVRIFSDPTES